MSVKRILQEKYILYLDEGWRTGGIFRKSVKLLIS